MICKYYGSEHLPCVEFCICAAVKTSTGKIFPGRRHGHCFVSIDRLALDEDKKREGHIQGFLTSHGRFVDRTEAMKIQKAAGIPSADPAGYQEGVLLSEDLY